MIRYEVTAVVEAALLDEFERYMLDEHVPDLLATGCFIGASVSRAAGNRLRMSYEAPSESSLRRYLQNHAPALREHAMSRFPAGVELSRDEWTEVRTYKDRLIGQAAFTKVAAATGLILLIPLVAMQFTKEVDWSHRDFAIMGLLLFGMGSLFILVARRVAHSRRLLVGALFLAALLYIWAELAVGIFTNLGS